MSITSSAVSTGTVATDLLTGPLVVVWVMNANAAVATIRDGAGGPIRMKVPAGVFGVVNTSFAGNLNIDKADVAIGYISSQ